MPAVISDEKMKVLLKEFVKAQGKLSSWVFPLGISIGLATGKLVKMYLLPKLNLSINICLAAYAAVLAICLVIFIFTAIRAVFYLPAASIGGLIKKNKKRGRKSQIGTGIADPDELRASSAPAALFVTLLSLVSGFAHVLIRWHFFSPRLVTNTHPSNHTRL